MSKAILIIILLLVVTGYMFAQKDHSIEPSPLKETGESSKGKVDYGGFLLLSDSLQALRNSRLIDEQTFIQYSKDEHTIILDTRSKAAFEDIHIAGAVHLNFSDFTEQKLAEKIPHKETRILIYCNNNFESNRLSLANKRLPLALNIPTFINLHGYGYENVYELGEYLQEETTQIPLLIKDEKNLSRR